MDTERLRLRPGVPAAAAIATLRDLIRLVQNIAGGGGGRSPRQYASEYIMWVEQAEDQLRMTFASVWVWQGVFTSRYEEIRRVDQGIPRPHPLIRSEALAQAARLEAIVERLGREIQAFELPEGYVAAVPDTNVFLHYRRYDEIDWPRFLGAGGVRLVVPLIVVEELDAKKYTDHPVGQRAREVLSSLQRRRGSVPPEHAVKVRDTVDLQVLMDPDGHVRQRSNDEEFLDRAEDLADIVGSQRVVVVSGDHAVQLRAAGRQLEFVMLPDRLRLAAKGAK